MNNKKIYKTKQRDLILNYITENKTKHITVDMVVDYMKNNGEQVGQTTVYRNLNKLVEEGIVLKYQNAEGISACYQYAEEDEGCLNHYHLVCVECGEMIHLQCDYLERFSTHIFNEHEFKVNKFKTVFYGLCKNCTI